MMILNFTLLFTVLALPSESSQEKAQVSDPNPYEVAPKSFSIYQQELKNKLVSPKNINKWIIGMIADLKKYKPLKVNEEITINDYEFGKAVLEIRNLLAKKYKAPKELATYDRFIKNEILLKFVMKLWAILPTNDPYKTFTSGEAEDLMVLSEAVLGIQEALCLRPYTGYCTNKIDEVFKSVSDILDKTTLSTQEKEKRKKRIQKKIEDIENLYKKIIKKHKAIPDVDEAVENKAKEIDLETVKFPPGDLGAIKLFEDYMDYRKKVLKKYPKAYIYPLDEKLYEVSLVVEKMWKEDPNMTFASIKRKHRNWLMKFMQLLQTIRLALCQPSEEAKFCVPISKELEGKFFQELSLFAKTFFSKPKPTLSNEESEIKAD